MNKHRDRKKTVDGDKQMPLYTARVVEQKIHILQDTPTRDTHSLRAFSCGTVSLYVSIEDIYLSVHLAVSLCSLFFSAKRTKHRKMTTSVQQTSVEPRPLC